MATDFGIMPEALNRVIEARESRERAQGFFNDPVGWAKYMLDVDLWSKQREVVEALLHNKSTAVKAGHGVGKAEKTDNPVLTTSGWKTIGTLAVGDSVFDNEGQPTKVVNKSEVWCSQGYKVTFDDNTSVVVHANHEWNVLDLSRRTAAMKRGVQDWREHWDDTRTYETQELLSQGVKTTSNQNRWRIPLAASVQMPEADLPIDPYLLGFWLGDGSKTSGQMFIAHDKVGVLGHFNRSHSPLESTEHRPGGYVLTIYGLTKELREAGILNNKHIPLSYLLASENQRRELLAGIMDSDGFLMKTTGGADVGIDMTNKQLIDDIETLVNTLGYKVFRKEGTAAYTKDGERHVTGTRYRLNWTPDRNPFKVRGKNWAGGNGQRSRHTQRTIVNIEVVGTVETQCIEVDSPRHLYLSGKQLVPTHNSFLSAILVCWWVDTRYPDCKVATTAPSWSQVNTIIWDEVRKMKVAIDVRFNEGLIDHKLPGYITTQAEWKRDEDGLVVAMGRRPPENKEDSAFQGLHGRVLAIGDEACHDADTDVLTRRGWVSWKDVSVRDEFLTKDDNTGTLSYQKPTRLIAYHYDGPMYHYSNQTSDFMVTPNHEMIYRTAVAPDVIRRAEIQDMVFSNKRMDRMIEGHVGTNPGTFVVPGLQTERGYREPMTFDIEDWAEFLGWFLSEGSVAKTKYTTRITQKKEHHKKSIRALLTRMGFDFKEYAYVGREGTTDFAIHGRQLAEFLTRNGRTSLTKRVPAYVREWTPDLISVFLDAYVAGDGYNKQGVDIIYTSSPLMADDLQELVLLTGDSSTLSVRPPVTGVPLKDGRRVTSTTDNFVVTRSPNSSRIRLRKEALSVVEYSGTVFCAEVPNHSLFTRRRGKTLWSGNCGLTGELIDGLGNITSNESSRRLLIGNPTNPHSYFGKIFKDSDGSWKLVSISVLDSPNFTDEAKQMSAEALDKLSGPSYVEDKKVEYGEDSARYKARVLGEFAYDIEGDIFIKPEDVAKCYDTNIDLRTFEGAPVLGVDVSGTGEDSSIIYINHGGHVRFLDKQVGSQFSWETAQWVDRHATNTGATQVRIDSNGIGEGVYGELCRLAAEHGRYIVIGMKGQSASPNKHQWRNARAYWWDNTRTEMRLGKIDLDPDDDILTDELVSVLYAYDDNTLGTGGLLIESKISMRKRGVKSPDYADAFMYACADLSDIVGSPLAGLRNGDTVMIEDEQPAWAVFGW